MSDTQRKRIAVFSGPTATVQNTVPLVTSNKARRKYGLPLLTGRDGTPIAHDQLRPQRLAAPVTVYVRQFSAHPLERDASELYGPPDGYVDANGVFSRERKGEADVAVYEVTLEPADGLYLLPYMARQADGEPWDDDTTHPGAPATHARQPFLPDASRLFEEIDRFGLHEVSGMNNLLSGKSDFDFIRVVPSAGYKKGLAAAERTDVGEGDIAAERIGEDFFNYRPFHLWRDPPRHFMARVVNTVQAAMDSGKYAGGIWLEGSPNMEESLFWMNLLIDTALPICGNSSQRPHGSIGNDGDHNVADSVDWILSGAWQDANGCNAAGVVAVLDQLVYTAREVQKADARPGGYVATGGHGGIIGSMGHAPGNPVLTFVPARRHTRDSAVNLRRLPASVDGVVRVNGEVKTSTVTVKDEQGWLLPSALPEVRFVKSARYLPASADMSDEGEVEILARIEKNLADAPLAGFVAEGQAGNAKIVRPMDSALRRAVFSGMPVVRVGRGNAEGIIPADRTGLTIGGGNLTANKARILLMACMLKLGCVPPAGDASNPTPAEIVAVKAKVAEYQAIFDTH
jgi:L-asparaginase